MNYYFDENFVNFINSPFLLFLQLTLLWQEKQNYVHNEHKSWDSHLHKTWCRTRLHEPECQRLSKETNTAVAQSLVTWHRDMCIRGFRSLPGLTAAACHHSLTSRSHPSPHQSGPCPCLLSNCLLFLSVAIYCSSHGVLGFCVNTRFTCTFVLNPFFPLAL